MTETLIDMLRSRKLELFKNSGNYSLSAKRSCPHVQCSRERLKGCVQRSSRNLLRTTQELSTLKNRHLQDVCTLMYKVKQIVSSLY